MPGSATDPCANNCGWPGSQGLQCSEPFRDEIVSMFFSSQAVIISRPLITGTLPPALSKLTGLTSLGLSGYPQLSGPIDGLSSLSKLRYLGIDNNNLSGSVSTLQNFKDLSTVFTYCNRFTGVIPSLPWNQLNRTFACSLGGPKYNCNYPGGYHTKTNQFACPLPAGIQDSWDSCEASCA